MRQVDRAPISAFACSGIYVQKGIRKRLRAHRLDDPDLVDFHREDELPEVVVFVISGPPLALPVEQLVSDFANMLSERLGASELARWQRQLAELIEAETQAFAETHEVLGESMTEEALDPYYIWQNRN